MGDKEPMLESANPLVLGYLISQYPATSHTFIRREVAALRRKGITMRTYASRRGDIAQDEETRTFVILDQPLFAFFTAHLSLGILHPLRYISTLRLALSHRAPGLKSLLWALFHFAEAVVLARRLRADGVGRLHNHFANSGATIGLLTAYLLQMPWSLTLHGISEFDYPAGLLLARKLERAEFAACVSWFGMAQAMRLTPPSIWPRLSIVRCAIDPAALPASVTRESDGPRPFRLIGVGRLSPEKGYAGLISVVAGMIRDGYSLELRLVGSGPDEAMLRRLVKMEGAEKGITFLGRLDEKKTLQQVVCSDALVLASFMEGLPVVLMEALALGVPAVASRVAGIPELVQDGETGLLFDPGNWQDLRGALERLLADPLARKRMAENGRKLALAEFSYPAAAVPLISLLRPDHG